jgi:hypothetical protein
MAEKIDLKVGVQVDIKRSDGPSVLIFGTLRSISSFPAVLRGLRCAFAHFRSDELSVLFVLWKRENPLTTQPAIYSPCRTMQGESTEL